MNFRFAVPLKISPDLHDLIREAAKATQLSQADVMRHSLRLGLPLFVSQFPQPMLEKKRAAKWAIPTPEQL